MSSRTDVAFRGATGYVGNGQRDVGRKLIESQSMRRYLIKMHIKWKYVVFAFGLTLIGLVTFIRLSPWVAQDV